MLTILQVTELFDREEFIEIVYSSKYHITTMSHRNMRYLGVIVFITLIKYNIGRKFCSPLKKYGVVFFKLKDPGPNFWCLKGNNQLKYFLFHRIAGDSGFIIWYKVCDLGIPFSSLNSVFNILWHVSE